MTTYRLMDGLSGRPGNGPSSGTTYSGPYIAGVMFTVTQGGIWFEGYWWWVASSNQDTASGQEFALWQVDGASGGVRVPGSEVTAGALTAGAWNFVPLAAPLLLAPAGFESYGGVYLAATGYTSGSGIPFTANQFGTGDPYSAGIVNGPLNCPSSFSGSNQAGQSFSGWSKAQMPFSISGSDPSTTFPAANNSDANLWLDVQVSDAAPGGTLAFRGFPNMPVFAAQLGATSLAYTLGLEFVLSQACALQKIWHYSPSGSVVLPSRCGIWDVASQAEVSGTDNSSPAWKVAGGGAASPGAGWIYCDYSGSGVTLNASQNYKVSTFTGNNTDAWFQPQTDVWGDSPGPFSSGITQGPLHILSDAEATAPGQSTWHNSSTWTYPDTTAVAEYDGVDVEVTPQSGTPHTATAALTVTPSSAANRARSRNRAGMLAVTPSFSAARTRGRYRAAAATVSPAFSVTRAGRKYRAAALTVPPSFSAARSKTHPAPAVAGPQLDPFPDIELLLIGWLQPLFPGTRICTELPADITETTVHVTRISGAARDLRVDHPIVDIDVYALDHATSVSVALAIDAAVRVARNVVTENGVLLSANTVNGPRWLPEPNPGLRRRSATYLFYVHS